VVLSYALGAAAWLVVALGIGIAFGKLVRAGDRKALARAVSTRVPVSDGDPAPLLGVVLPPESRDSA
jgi:hypothetical protein